MKDINRVVVCAAIRSGEHIICCVRHYDKLMRAAIKASVHKWPMNTVEQGFVDNNGKYLTREEAWIVAKEAKQIVRRVGGDEKGCLYSENLY